MIAYLCFLAGVAIGWTIGYSNWLDRRIPRSRVELPEVRIHRRSDRR